MTDFSLEALWQQLDADGAGAATRRYCVAFSGGLDSTVLLVALHWLSDRFPKDGLRALHVHHGLHPEADKWAGECEARCRELGVPFEVLRVDARPAPGESPEAKAREVRYRALAGQLKPGEVLLTAHHADDQLETVLIQLLRGAGPAGLAAMPLETDFGPGRHRRPLLAFERESLEDWARTQGLSGWLDDPANEERRLSRNHLRHEVLPALRVHWPAAAQSVARSARHCAEATALLDELGAIDAAACGDGESLDIEAMRALSPARHRNLVRWHARQLGLVVPDERRLATLLAQALGAADDMQPQVRWPGVVALRHGGRLWLIAAERLAPPIETIEWPDPREPLRLPGGLGTLSLEPTTAGGLAAAALESGRWRVVGRRGGEKLRLPRRGGSRSLKKLMHAAGVPPWWRARMPLLEIGGRLAAAGDLWIDESWWAPSGTKAWRLCWRDSGLPGRSAFIVGEEAF
jgi:tRNA(Ile)-lysidine synthase